MAMIDNVAQEQEHMFTTESEKQQKLEKHIKILEGHMKGIKKTLASGSITKTDASNRFKDKLRQLKPLRFQLQASHTKVSNMRNVLIRFNQMKDMIDMANLQKNIQTTMDKIQLKPSKLTDELEDNSERFKEMSDDINDTMKNMTVDTKLDPLDEIDDEELERELAQYMGVEEEEDMEYPSVPNDKERLWTELKRKQTEVELQKYVDKRRMLGDPSFTRGMDEDALVEHYSTMA